MSLRPSRYTTFLLCAAILVIALPFAFHRPWVAVVAVIAGVLTAIGIYDLIQTRHAILRNYPVLGHIRWLVEMIRPEIRQYLIEDEDEAAPFSRSQRSLVYSRSKNEGSEIPFGTLMEVYRNGYEFIGHSTRPVPAGDPKTFRVKVGGPQCTQPYEASVLNISGMSFGSLGAAAIRALNKGAAMGGFAHDTGEGSISAYHREHGGDLVWQIASGYFGCRTANGQFDPALFAERAKDPQIKMIEIKLSQGAKPGHGGILPGPKVTREISETRGVPMGVDCISPAHHSAFSTPIEMMQFVQRLRELSGGKPIGFKFCLGHPWEFMSIVKAMLETKILPDFIVVDGAEGGTGAAPMEFSNHVGAPMREGLLFVHNTLVATNLRPHIKIGAAGKVVSAFDIARALALGADWTNSGRGFMFAVGCVQSRTCNTNRCPTGVATQDPLRQRALVVEDKADRVANFHRNTLRALSEMLAAAGCRMPSELGPHHIVRRVNATEIKLYSKLFPFLAPGELLDDKPDHPLYATSWQMARADSFDPIRAA